jgi:cyclic pyranopterin phosphate synthase
MAAVKDTLGRPLRSLRISVTDRCNFRCGYCMPAELFPPDHPFLPREDILTFEEVSRLAALFVSVGIRKIRLTGGEPLLRKGLPDLVRMLKAIPGLQDIALTSNGVLLREQASALKAAGLDRLTVSLDSLDPVKFAKLSDTTIPLAKVLDGIAAAREAGFPPVKLNCVLQKGVNEADILPLARFAREQGLLLRFIEYMDVGSALGWSLDKVVPAAEVRAVLAAVWPLLPAPGEGESDVARHWRYADGSGEVGCIASVTEPFCSGCDRLRLSADGHLYTCLFAADGLDLKALLRGGADDASFLAVLRGRWSRRDDRYSEIRTAATAGLPRVPMHRVGG